MGSASGMRRWMVWGLLALGLHASGRCETVDVFGADDYPVICFLEDGKARGVFPQILEGVSKFSGDTYTLQLLPWKRAQGFAEAGKGGVAHFSKTSEREAHFDFSEVVYGDRIQMVVLKGRDFPFKALADLNGKRIGIKSGASFGQEVDAYLASSQVKVESDPRVESRLNKLLLNRIDVAIVEGASGDIDKLLGKDASLLQNRDKFVFLPVPLVDDALYLAFAKSMNRGQTLERFNRALAKFKKTDAYKKLAPRV